MQTIKIDPWIGNNFESPTFNDHSTLVLGESHYANRKTVSRSFTKELVESYMDKTINRSTFWTNVGQLVSGKHHSSSEFNRSKVWNDFAFYNYIQGIFSNKPRVKPEQKFFRQSEERFFQIINQLKPKLVVALGRRLYNRMYPLYEEKIQIDKDLKAKKYKISGHSFICCYVNHPSTGFSYKTWNSRLKRFQTWMSSNNY